MIRARLGTITACRSWHMPQGAANAGFQFRFVLFDEVVDAHKYTFRLSQVGSLNLQSSDKSRLRSLRYSISRLKHNLQSIALPSPPVGSTRTSPLRMCGPDPSQLGFMAFCWFPQWNAFLQRLCTSQPPPFFVPIPLPVQVQL